ncbi:MAG: hypothetical protein HKO64_02625 [Xanthomonadales bacterium]|nr:hypothetical protein [Xanthomonadales bacterium]
MKPCILRTPGLILAATVTMLLVACGGILESGSQPERIYWLEPLAANDGHGEPAGPVLTVSVTVVPGLDSDHLLTIGPGPELSRFSAARWPANLPEYVSSLLIRSLAGSGSFSRVTRDAAAKLDACELELEIDRFYTRLGVSRVPQAVEISMAGIFRCGKNMSPLRIVHRQSVSGGRISDVVAAHQQAINDATRELISTLSNLHIAGDEMSSIPALPGSSQIVATT